MELINYPSADQWASIVKRPAVDLAVLTDTVHSILQDIRNEGDRALLAYEERFDKVVLSTPMVSPAEVDEAETGTGTKADTSDGYCEPGSRTDGEHGQGRQHHGEHEEGETD